MKNTDVLDDLQKIIDIAETLASVIPGEAMDDIWIQETIDNALGELERASSYLKDKYDVDANSIPEIDDPELESFLDEDILDDDLEDFTLNTDEE